MSNEEYREEIIKMLETINDEKILNYISIIIQDIIQDEGSGKS